MYQATVHRLGFNFDRSQNALVFTGQLENGFQFQIAFPISHVAVTFDREMAAQGYMGDPIMGDIASIDGFFSSIKNAIKKVAMAPVNAALAPIKAVVPKQVTNAFNKTVNKVGNQALHYARAGANFVAKQTLVPFKAVYDIASGKNVLQSLKGVAQQVQVAASFVPGIGTLASMGLGGVLAAVEGKSLAEIAKGVAAGAIPGGPLVIATAQTAINMASAGIQGQNILKAARTELIKGAASMIPNPQLQQLVANAALAAASGQNVLQSAQGALIRTALAQIPDSGARAALTAAVQGSPTATLIQQAGPKLLTAVAAKPDSNVGAIVGAVVTQGAKAKGAMHGPFGMTDAAHLFPAIGAAGLAAHHAARVASRNPAAVRNRVAMLARSSHPSARLVVAGFKSVRV